MEDILFGCYYYNKYSSNTVRTRVQVNLSLEQVKILQNPITWEGKLDIVQTLVNKFDIQSYVIYMTTKYEWFVEY